MRRCQHCGQGTFTKDANGPVCADCIEDGYFEMESASTQAEAPDDKARIEALEAENKAMREALRSHHNHQSDLGIIFTKDDAGEFHEIDMSDGYAESGLCSQTIAALQGKATS